MESENLLRARGAVLADAVVMLAKLPGSAKQEQYAGLRRTAAADILAAAATFEGAHVVVSFQATEVKQNFEHLMSGAIQIRDLTPKQIELAKLAVKAAADGHWASFRGLEALLEVRPMAAAEGTDLAGMILRAYEALARAQVFLSATR